MGKAFYKTIKNNNHLGENISHVFDQLTGVHEKNGTYFEEKQLMHDDNYVFNNIDNNLYGFDNGCNIIPK